MTSGETVLPALMTRLFLRIREELSDGTLGDLRMSHVRVLMAVPPAGLSVTELAQRVTMTKQGCGQFVTQLGVTGHLSTAPDPADRRVRLVHRTPKGDRFIDGVLATLARLEAELTAEVGERRYATFRRVLAELGQAR